MSTGTPLSAPALRELRYWLFRYRRTWRGTIVINVVNPLLFLTAIGIGLGRLITGGDALPGYSYLEFVVPGLLVAAAMQTTYIEAAGPVFQSVRGRKNYLAAAATPMSPSDILYGHLLYIVIRVATTALAFGAVAAAMGALPVGRGVLVVLSGVLVGAAFATTVAALAVTVKRASTMQAIFRFVIMSMYMLSGTFFPLDDLTPALRWLAQLTPLWHGVELARGFALGTATAGGVAVHTAYLLVMALVGLLIARRTFRKNLYV
ncbi:lipooligosaccharide transport system permease protein [Allocatelliglobosispora scoriae]|uniref:Transport permease protein n=1 Tax=Allocatelliglobosispora scoriae TaxID=643052 RepID=A0A841BMG2_9ACTN|nr:ABC transporter permease [Allocatelliglobosispora scoriae]MBB5868446.1 lipooligosaccharide transport system permease protein [Allocatelliglobosispora scoriae]